jgi:hypothetical protein
LLAVRQVFNFVQTRFWLALQDQAQSRHLRKSRFRLKNTGKSVMNRIDFFRRQAERFSTLAQECPDRKISDKLLKIASEYREMLNGKGSDDAQDRSITP